MSLANGNELNAETFNEFVQRLGHHVRGEGVDWHHTADAIFTVQYREIVFGIDRDYADKLAVGVDESMYFSPKEYWDEADEDLRARLDEIADEEGETNFLSLDESDQWDILGELPEHTVSGWDERWVHLNSHFTKEAAEAFIARKKHDYRKGLRVYVEAQVYCWEFNAIIRGLLDGQIVFAQAATEAAKATGTAGDPDADAEMAKVKRDVELMGVGFLVDGKRCSLDRITWFNRPGDTWLPPPPGYPTEAARQPAPVVAVTRIDTGYGNYLEFERKTTGKSGWLVRTESGDLVRALNPTEVLLVDSALAATAAPVLSDEQMDDNDRELLILSIQDLNELASGEIGALGTGNLLKPGGVKKATMADVKRKLPYVVKRLRDLVAKLDGAATNRSQP